MNRQIIYIPTLHPALAPDALPPDILFVCPGLPLAEGERQKFFIPADLPFTPAQAGSALREMLDLGFGFDPGGDLRFLAGQGWLEQEEARKRALAAKENAALSRFTNAKENAAISRFTGAEENAAISRFTGAEENAALANSTDAEEAQSWAGAFRQSAGQAGQLKNAHKALLLAWEHEESILAINALEKKLAEGQARLSAALADPDAETPGTAPAEKSSPGYSWRIITDALSAFLPPQTILFSAEAQMLESLRDNGLLQPLPGDLSATLGHWPPALLGRLLWAYKPLWRILNYSSLPQDRPWLGASYELLIAARPG